MNDREFKQHLKDLIHGHHHPEEHDWAGGRGQPAKTPPEKHKVSRRRAPKKK